MGYVWRIVFALVGLLLVRGFIYPRGWGHRRLVHLVVAIAGASMTAPLINYSQAGFIGVLVAAFVVLLPYRAIAARYLRARARSGLKELARSWGGELREERKTGLWNVAVQLNGTRKWAGNVLTHIRSIHPGVKKSEVGYMLAFVIELPEPPPFHCSLMYGWKSPRYFDREWRSTYVMQGDHFAMSVSDLLEGTDKGRETGGRSDQLQPLPVLPGARHDLNALSTESEEFARVFSGEFLEEFKKVSEQTFPYELNVTPSSVSVYTTYCEAEAQRANVELLEKLSVRLAGRSSIIASAEG